MRCYNLCLHLILEEYNQASEKGQYLRAMESLGHLFALRQAGFINGDRLKGISGANNFSTAASIMTIAASLVEGCIKQAKDHINACPRCGGARSIDCPHCDGKGKVSASCAACEGKGATTCSSCNGAGKLTCAKCEGRGGASCSKCKGTGVVPGKTVYSVPGRSRRYRSGTSGAAAACSVCKGRGYFVCRSCKGAGNLKCRKCNGTGVLRCRKCRGKGKVLEACTACDSRGKVTCPQCKGAGKKKTVEEPLEIKNLRTEYLAEIVGRAW